MEAIIYLIDPSDNEIAITAKFDYNGGDIDNIRLYEAGKDVTAEINNYTNYTNSEIADIIILELDKQAKDANDTCWDLKIQEWKDRR